MFSNNLTAEKSSSHGNVSDILFPSGPFPKGAQFCTSILHLPLRDNIPHGPMDAAVQVKLPTGSPTTLQAFGVFRNSVFSLENID